MGGQALFFRIDMQGRTMDCGEFLKGYSEYLDARVEGHVLLDYRVHLGDCPRCTEYDRVMRRGLKLVKELDPPDSSRNLLPAVRRVVLARPARPRSGAARELGKAAAIAGLAAASLLAMASARLLQQGGATLELAPVVVDSPAEVEGLPSLFGPPPTFAPAASFLRAPDPSSQQLLLAPTQRISLFRDRPSHTDRPLPASEEVAPR